MAHSARNPISPLLGVLCNRTKKGGLFLVACFVGLLPDHDVDVLDVTVGHGEVYHRPAHHGATGERSLN